MSHLETKEERNIMELRQEAKKRERSKDRVGMDELQRGREERNSKLGEREKNQ